MVKAVIFDMDGVLVDSEPFWRQAEMRVFGSVGLNLTEEMCIETMGMRLDQVVDHWFEFKAWEEKSKKIIHDEILDAMEDFIRSRAVPMVGVFEAFEFFRSRAIPMAIASSSAMRLINAVVDKFEIRGYFQTLGSAEFEPYGKPHPGVYMTTAEKLGMVPEHCLAIEDSFNGLISAKAALMKTIVIPEASVWKETKYDIADVKLKHLAQISTSGKVFGLLRG